MWARVNHLTDAPLSGPGGGYEMLGVLLRFL